MHGRFDQIPQPVIRAKRRRFEQPARGWNIFKDWRLPRDGQVLYQLSWARTYARYNPMRRRETRDAIRCLTLLIMDSSDRIVMPAMQTINVIAKRKFRAYPQTVCDGLATLWQKLDQMQPSKARDQALSYLHNSWKEMLPAKIPADYRSPFGVTRSVRLPAAPSRPAKLPVNQVSAEREWAMAAE